MTVMDLLHVSDKPRMISADELSEFCADLETHGEYQILAARMVAADGCGHIEFIVTYETPK